MINATTSWLFDATPTGPRSLAEVAVPGESIKGRTTSSFITKNDVIVDTVRSR